MAPSVKKEKFSLANKFLINLSNCSSNASFTLRTYLLCGIDLGIPRYVILAKKIILKAHVFLKVAGWQVSGGFGLFCGGKNLLGQAVF